MSCSQDGLRYHTNRGARKLELATVFDGVTRHNPEGLWFRRYAPTAGFKAAVEWRNSGRPIPQGDEARALVAQMDAQLAVSNRRKYRTPP